MTISFQIDDYGLEEFVRQSSGFGTAQYGYVVTPNVDHLIRYYDDSSFRDLYGAAAFVLLDSRILALLVRITQRLELNVCTGSDLTAQLFRNVIASDDKVILIGGSDDQAAQLSSIFSLRNLLHYNPPMGFIRDPMAVDACLEFIERESPFRFCLLAIGSPQQEIVAYQLKLRARAKGLALCVGASVDFLTGKESRAPLWMQKLALEWLYRLLRSPARLASRYLVRGPRVFWILRRIKFNRRSSGKTTPSARVAT